MIFRRKPNDLPLPPSYSFVSPFRVINKHPSGTWAAPCIGRSVASIFYDPRHLKRGSDGFVCGSVRCQSFRSIPSLADFLYARFGVVIPNLAGRYPKCLKAANPPDLRFTETDKIADGTST